jgi:putative transposase
MARLPRLFIEGQPHHVIQRGNNRTPIFRCDEDFLYFERCLGKAVSECGVAIHAIVLMTNHVHLLVTPATPESLPRAMQSLGRRYVQHFNRSHGRTGTLWEGRYRSTLINTERHFLICMRYIERNPERAHLVSRPEDYRWSSYRANALGADCGVALTPHQVYLALGPTSESRQSAYRGLFRRELPLEDIEAIRQATNRAWLLGTPESTASCAQGQSRL